MLELRNWLLFKKLNNSLGQQGITLIEVLVSISVMSLLTLSIYKTLFGAVQHVGDAKQRVGAISLGNERMELFRNLPYDKVGIVGGIVNGPIPAYEEINKNGFNYIVKADVRYEDDPLDKVFPDDLVNNDYKSVQVVVEWTNGGETKSVNFYSIFVPDGVETNIGGGTLSVNTVNSNGEAVTEATVQIDSLDNNPEVHYSTSTDNNGNLVLPGVPAQSYRLTVSKNGYETVSTYPNPPEGEFVPIDPDILVTEGDLIVKSFIIDKTGDLTIRSINVENDEGLSGIDFDLFGGRKISNEPEYEFNFKSTETSNSSGEIILTDLSPGMYNVTNLDTLGNSTYAYIEADETVPFELHSEENKTVTFFFADKTKDSVLAKITNAADENPIEGATVRLWKEGFDQTVLTSANGFAYFPLPADPPITLEKATYTIEVTADGYQNYTGEVVVDGLAEKAIALTAL